MNRKQTGPIPEAIAQLQRQFDRFRSSQPRRSKLPEPLWQAAGRRSVHEFDPHVRTEWRQSVRLSDRVTAARRGVEAKPLGVDAMELSRDISTAGEAGRCVI